nr:LytTR family DNA-binding domain-containing protein [Granulosicoccus sp.]
AAMTLSALIADDEPLLRKALLEELNELMPELDVVVEAADGLSALESLRRNPVDIAFLDIRMHCASVLDVAQTLLDTWHTSSNADRHAPLVVFVTAFDEYAVDAFEAEAVDYILKPLTRERLMVSVEKIRKLLKQRNDLDRQLELETKLERALAKISHGDDGDGEQGNKRGIKPLRSIRASMGGRIHLLPVEDVILLQADDKYVSVYTSHQHALIRESLSDLLPRLPNESFVQVHRSSIVNLAFVETADRSSPGKMRLTLRGIDLQPVVSRSYRHHFKAM